MAEILKYEHVDITYNGVCAVKDVSFTVSEGEILGIVGESGSGKSTLIKAAMGLLGPDGLVTRGDIRYKGKNVPDLPENGREVPRRNGHPARLRPETAARVTAGRRLPTPAANEKSKRTPT